MEESQAVPMSDVLPLEFLRVEFNARWVLLLHHVFDKIDSACHNEKLKIDVHWA